MHSYSVSVSQTPMDHYRRQNVVVNFVFVVPLVYILAANLTISLLVVHSDGRYLRPSDHGLAYQDNSSRPTKGNDLEMISFFNGGESIPLPVAKNITSAAAAGGGLAGSAWWNHIERRRSREARKNRVREILLITCLVCGLTGVVLLVVSAFLFLLRRLRGGRQQQRRPPQLGLGAGWSKHESHLSTPDSTSALANGVQIK